MGKSQNDPEVLSLNDIINKDRKSGRQAALGERIIEFEMMVAYPNRNTKKNGRNKSLEAKKGPGLE